MMKKDGNRWSEARSQTLARFLTGQLWWGHLDFRRRPTSKRKRTQRENLIYQMVSDLVPCCKLCDQFVPIASYGFTTLIVSFSLTSNIDLRWHVWLTQDVQWLIHHLNVFYSWIYFSLYIFYLQSININTFFLQFEMLNFYNVIFSRKLNHFR